MAASFDSPLVVPSFSSRGFPQVRRNKIKDVTRNHFSLFSGFFDALLVSAFDLHYGYIPQDALPDRATIFVDSGGYESREWEDDSATHLKRLPNTDEPWNQELLAKTIAQLPDETRFIYVNFDLERGLEAQVASAKEQLRGLRRARKSFLLKEDVSKPVTQPISSMMSEIPRVAGALRDFDVFGVTEKALGDTYEDRLQTLQQLCALLHECRLEVPVHVFGALDPVTVRAYALAGARIFDGLTWIRFAYRDGRCVYLANDIMDASELEVDFTEARNAIFNRNYLALKDLQEELTAYFACLDPKMLALEPHIRDKVLRVLGRGKQNTLRAAS